MSDSMPPSRKQRVDVDAPILSEGRNCWKIAHADRFACLVDGDAYFRAVYSAMEKAERSIFILGWDINSRVELLRPAPGDGRPVQFAAFLEHLVRTRRRLQAYVLTWDYASVYTLEREPLQRLRIGLGLRRLHFRFDAKHPFGASHHQKIVVVDDKVAFCGGLDITGHRWDRPEHLPEDPLRLNAVGKPYAPFHDVQAVVDGEAALRLAEIARERWQRVSLRRPIAVSSKHGGDPWPEHVVPDILDVPVGIARTQPKFGRVSEVREVERLYYDSIAAAREAIYIENQYFTSPKLGAALVARLSEPGGPEIVVVGPKTCSGWLEHKTMGALRHRVLRDLVGADHEGRLRLLHPVASRAQGCEVFIHSKVMAVDERFLRIGSSNLSSRSLGLDTECDLAVEAHGRGAARIAAGIALVRARLCAEHLGVDPPAFQAELSRSRSLAATFDALGQGERGVCTIAVDLDDASEPLVPADLGVDPEGPLRVTRAIDRFLPEILRAQSRSRRRFAIAAVASMLLVLAYALAPRIPALAEIARVDRLASLAASLSDHPAAGTFALVGLFAATLLSVPLSLLVLATALVFGGIVGAALAFCAVIPGAILIYGVGRWLGPATTRAYPESFVVRLARKLAGRRLISVALLRIAPVAPAALVHFACGAARIRLRDYVAGTALGILPGIAALAIFGHQLGRLLRAPSLREGWILVAIALALALIAARARRTLALHPGSERLDPDLARFAHD